MTKVPFILGAYTAKSLIASAQRCLNLYPEINPDGSPFPTTLYQTPGLNCLGAPLPGDFTYTGNKRYWRGLYTANNGKLYGVVGADVWRIDNVGGWTFTHLGAISTIEGQVYMLDNSIQVLLVDGSEDGYTIDLEDDAFAVIDNDAFYGSDRVDLLDGYLLLNRPGTRQWYISDGTSTDFNALDFATKTGFGDTLVAVRASKQQIFLFGEETTEVWYNSGDAAFTFARMPGAFIQHGCASSDSITQIGASLMWLGQDGQGHATVLMTDNYDGVRISTHAIEQEINGYSRIDDAISYGYREDGHEFYVLSFPTADKTWVYDTSSQLWHERAYIDDNGDEHRHISNCAAFFKGMHIVGAHNSTNLFHMTEDVADDAGQPIKRLVSSPHGVSDGNRVRYDRFIVDISSGTGEALGTPCPPEPELPGCVTLTYSGNSSAAAIGNGVTLNPNGGQVFIVKGGSGTGTVERYGLSTPFDLSTITAIEQTLDISAEVLPGQTCVSIRFLQGGTKMYVLTTSDTVYQYDLSVAWDITTGVYSGNSLNITATDNNARGIDFKPDGTILYIAGNANDKVYQYSLSIAGDLSTASYTGKFLDIGGEATLASGIAVIGDGERILVGDSTTVTISYYNMATAYDISTATLGVANLPLHVSSASFIGLWSDNEMNYVYVMLNNYSNLYEYNGGICPPGG